MSTGSLLDQSCLNSACTEVHINYIWVIENFSEQSLNVGQCLKSPKFSAAQCFLGEWYLTCYPRGNTKGLESHISVYLYSDFPVNAKAVLSVRDRNGENTNIIQIKLWNYIPGEGYGAPKLISRNDLETLKNLLLPGGALSIQCEIIAYRFMNPLLASMGRIVKDLSKLLLDPEISDISFVVGDKKIPAHKLILSSRSPVFSRMLQSEMKESASSEIKIDDISEEALQEMLRYLYTDMVQNLNTLSHELYYAADKYEIEGLKTICSISLKNNLSLNNCVETLVLSERHGDSILKTSTLDYVSNNLEEVMEQEAWMKMVEPNALLLKDVLRHYVKKVPKK